MEIKVLWAFVPGVALIVFTIGLVVFNLRKAKIQKKADWWSAEMGTVKEVKLNKKLGFWLVFPAFLNKPEITYEYSFEGKKHQGTVLNYQGDAGWLTKRGAGKFLKTYRKGNTIPVHVNPNAPEQCYLEIDRRQSRIGGILFFGVVISTLLVGYSLYPEKFKNWFEEGKSWTQETIEGLQSSGTSTGSSEEEGEEENWVVKTKNKVTKAATEYYSLLPWNEDAEGVGEPNEESDEEKGMLDWT